MTDLHRLVDSYRASDLHSAWGPIAAAFPDRDLPEAVIRELLREPVGLRELADDAGRPPGPERTRLEALHRMLGRRAIASFLPADVGRLAGLVRGWRARRHRPGRLDDDTVDESIGELAIALLEEPFDTLAALAESREIGWYLTAQGYNALRRVLRRDDGRKAEPLPTDVEAPTASVPSAVEDGELIEALRERLPDTAFRAMELKAQGAGVEELAATLGRSRATVYRLLARASRLARDLAERTGWE